MSGSQAAAGLDRIARARPELLEAHCLRRGQGAVAEHDGRGHGFRRALPRLREGLRAAGGGEVSPDARVAAGQRRGRCDGHQTPKVLRLQEVLPLLCARAVEDGGDRHLREPGQDEVEPSPGGRMHARGPQRHPQLYIRVHHASGVGTSVGARRGGAGPPAAGTDDDRGGRGGPEHGEPEQGHLRLHAHGGGHHGQLLPGARSSHLHRERALLVRGRVARHLPVAPSHHHGQGPDQRRRQVHGEAPRVHRSGAAAHRVRRPSFEFFKLEFKLEFERGPAPVRGAPARAAAVRDGEVPQRGRVCCAGSGQGGERSDGGHPALGHEPRHAAKSVDQPQLVVAHGRGAPSVANERP
mmetsp:Transcript_17690/g.40626  ORF Transcript_17690/g.40626 Transcript_17690/m.40626 type:complete len:353 (-) Transcript_17690:1764-2822(-)